MPKPFAAFNPISGMKGIGFWCLIYVQFGPCVCSTSKRINDIANSIYHKLLFTHCSHGNENDSLCHNSLQTLKNQAHHKEMLFFNIILHKINCDYPLNCKSRISILRFGVNNDLPGLVISDSFKTSVHQQ